MKMDYSVEFRFTETYKKYQSAHIAIREAMCLRELYPATLGKIQRGDVFAGRLTKFLVGFAPQTGGCGYHCDIAALTRAMTSEDTDESMRQKLKELLEFWTTKVSAYKTRDAFPEDLKSALPSDQFETDGGVAFPIYRISGTYLDYAKLIHYGLGGLKELIRKRKEELLSEKKNADLFTGMEMVLDMLTACCIYYRDMALAMAKEESDPDMRREFKEMAEVLENISENKPQSLRESMQLLWIYAIVSDSRNYGRMDVILGDICEKDIQEGRITREKAQELVNGLWYLMAQRGTIFNGRVIIGGKGRRNEENADKFALMAMEASRVVKEVEPQLSLRFYEGMNETLMEKALEVIGEGRTFPMLYNDDVNIASVQNAFGLGLEEAEQFVPFGCGEYIIEHKSLGTPNGLINLLKAVEITMRNGREAGSGRLLGLETGRFEDFKTFDEFFEAYKKQVEYFISCLARAEKLEYEVCNREASYLLLSILYDDCIERGKALLDGGVRYLGGTIETYGNVNAADSLTAIKEIVYAKKLLTPQQLLQILDHDFQGYDREYRLLRDVPKYGNDDDAADEMMMRVHEHVCSTASKQADKVGLSSYLVVVINNNTNTILGKTTGASADGRKNGQHMANANNPWGGNDKKGLTAMLNSLVKMRTDIHAGAVQNMMFSPELFKGDKKLVKSVLKTYFDNGGQQAMISVVHKEDLEKAFENPENYGNLFVRVGGFSARFVQLDRSVQLEILSRTQY